MSDTFELIKLKAELSQSSKFGSQYDKILDTNQGSAFSNPLIEDISEFLNNIILKYDSLTNFQNEMLNKIFNEFNNIRIAIDPKRLKSFEHYFNADNELLLYRETGNGLTNIIINPDDCIAFSFIPSKGGERKLYFLYEDGDFETLAYNFFSA